MVAINPKDSADAILCTHDSKYYGEYEWIPTSDNEDNQLLIAQAHSFNIFRGSIEEVDPRFGMGDLEALEEEAKRFVGYAETEEEARELIAKDFKS